MVHSAINWGERYEDEGDGRWYGVPGMRWGHRKADDGEPEDAKPSALSKLSKKGALTAEEYEAEVGRIYETVKKDIESSENLHDQYADELLSRDYDIVKEIADNPDLSEVVTRDDGTSYRNPTDAGWREYDKRSEALAKEFDEKSAEYRKSPEYHRIVEANNAITALKTVDEVRANRLAALVGVASAAAYGGLVFGLKNAIQHSDEMMHEGVKGMKWGVHRTPTSKREAAAYNRAIIAMNKNGVKKLNKMPQYRDKEIKPGTALAKQYEEDAAKLFDAVYSAKNRGIVLRDVAIKGSVFAVSLAAGVAVVGTAVNIAMAAKGIGKPTEKQKVAIEANRSATLAHADDENLTFMSRLVLNKLGQIERFGYVEEVKSGMVHSDSDGDWLEYYTEDGDVLWYGVKGMKWGRRRSKAQLAADKEGPPALSEGPAGETASQRYTRLQANAKAGGAKNWSDADLKFFNSRTEAVKKVEKLYEAKPGFLKTALKEVLQNTTKNQLQEIAGLLAKKYVSGRIADKLSSKDTKKAAEKVINNSATKAVDRAKKASVIKKTTLPTKKS